MEKITKVLDFIFGITFVIVSMIVTIFIPAIGFFLLLGIEMINRKLFHINKFDAWIEDKVDKYYAEYFKDDIDNSSHSNLDIRFTKMFCKLCKAFISIKGCENIIQNLYFLKTINNTYDLFYETAIEVFNNK